MLITGSCPLAWGDPLNPKLRCHAHCLAADAVAHADSHWAKCFGTMHIAVQGEPHMTVFGGAVGCACNVVQ